MTIWRRKIDIKEEWQQAQSGKISSAELGYIIAAKLRELPEYLQAKDDELEDIVFCFKDLPEDATTDEFDDILERLYDWGDTTLDSSGPFSQWIKQCWIGTF